ncbi:MAG: helicase C-terminal domain-containing protein [Succinivibrio dextrinosolvens]|nr:helicase C-terminal domain-containing protein [Succinivibrio dextrinosolvens]
MTVHKSQGCTFPKVNLLSKSFFVPGQLYVALSRCRSLKTLHLEIGSNFYPSRKKLINDDVLEFYKETV